MVLHWNPMELLRIIAWRYLMYLTAYDKDRLNKFTNVDLTDRSDIHRILFDFIPNEIYNRSGNKEFSVAYILRHTQLIPRQIIRILNEAFSTSRPNTPNGAVNTSNNLINAVQIQESQICEEIFGAFKMKYPFVQNLCEICLPSLPRFFSEKLLEQVYREKGKKVMQEYSHIGEVGFTQYKQVLFEIGAIGRVRDRKDIYADADFEYALPGRLYASAADELCLHPSFSGTYETNINRTSEHFVYPHLRLYENFHKRILRI